MTKYSNELKLQAVICVLDKGYFQGDVAKQFGVVRSDIQKRVDRYKMNGVEGLTKKRFTEYILQKGLKLCIERIGEWQAK